MLFLVITWDKKKKKNVLENLPIYTYLTIVNMLLWKFVCLAKPSDVGWITRNLSNDIIGNLTMIKQHNKDLSSN